MLAIAVLRPSTGVRVKTTRSTNRRSVRRTVSPPESLPALSPTSSAPGRQRRHLTPATHSTPDTGATPGTDAGTVSPPTDAGGAAGPAARRQPEHKHGLQQPRHRRDRPGRRLDGVDADALLGFARASTAGSSMPTAAWPADRVPADRQAVFGAEEPKRAPPLARYRQPRWTSTSDS